MGRLLPILIILAAAIHFYRPPARAAELEVVPDSVEYAVAGHRFATTGRYEIQLNGRRLPPRYPPGFSMLFLAPIYRLAPRQIGNGILAVWIMAIAATLLTYLLGNQLAGQWGGVLAALLLTHHSQIALYTQLIMTDVPALALGLLVCWLYLRVREKQSARLYLLAGMVIALSVAIRPLSGILLVPFVADIVIHRRRGMWVNLLALCVPVLAAILGTSLQQKLAFGDWRRSGYQFWLAVPYDYLQLTFSPRYLRDNLGLLRWNLIYLPIIAGTLGAIALLHKRTAHARPLIAFLLLGAAPISIIHLFYFFMDIRFHFLPLALLCIMAGAGMAALVPLHLRNRFGIALPLLALAILVPRLESYPLEDQPPIRDHVATTAARLLPRNAVMISAIDPAYLEQRLTPGTSRRVLPIDRDTPYAQAWLTRRRIDHLDPPPRNAADHACAGLGHGGAERLYAFTANEEVETIAKWIDAGVPVYMDLLSTAPDRSGRLALARAFSQSAISSDAPWLVRLFKAK